MGALPVLQLMKVLEEGEDEYSRKLAALSLGRIGEPAVDPLLDAMNHPDPVSRRFAVEALGHIKSEPLGELSKGYPHGIWKADAHSTNQWVRSGSQHSTSWHY